MNLLQLSMKILALGLVVWVSACQSTSHEHHHANSEHESSVEGPVAELEKQVLATHDSLMPQMGELIRLKKAVTIHLDKATDVADTKIGVAVTAQLDSADHMMTDWMHEYNGDTLKKLDQTKALAYLKAEQLKVSALRDKMRKSITKATAYLD